MIMRYELVLAGVLLLACALAAKKVWDLPVLARVAWSLNFLWAVLAAFHVWPLVLGWVAGLAVVPEEAGSFWAALLLAVLPGWLGGRRLFREAQVEFPNVFDWVSGFAATALFVCLLPCLLIMTASTIPLLASEALPRDGIAGQAVTAMRRAPVEFYLRVAAATGGEKRQDLVASRLPPGLRQELFPTPKRGRGAR